MKKVLITGASGGIGLEVAKALALEGYGVTLLARSESKLLHALSLLSGAGHSIIVADLTSASDVEQTAHHVRENRYDVLINNAGAGTYGEFVSSLLEDQLRDMRLNMDAVVNLSYAFLKNAKPGDALVNVASILAHASLPGASVYAGTKAFVANFSESLWYEFKNKGVYVMGFNPGAAKSDFHVSAGREATAISEAFLSTTGEVAKELVVALKSRRKPRVVQGWKNRMMLFGFRFMPRRFAIDLMGGMSPGLSHA